MAQEVALSGISRGRETARYGYCFPLHKQARKNENIIHTSPVHSEPFDMP